MQEQLIRQEWLINQRGITWKLRKREQSFLYGTCHPDLIHIPINFFEDILNGK